MILINALLVVLPIGLTCGLIRTFSFMGNDVCYEPYNDVISDVDHVMSVTSCSVKCTKDTCCSFMYNAESQRCITSSGYPRNITPSGCGWKYMVNQNECKAPGPNTPYDPNLCQVGYSYNPAENKCVTSCNTYGTTFGISEDYNIPGFNNKEVDVKSTYSAHTQKICLDKCVNTTNFICRSVEMFRYNKLCNLSNHTTLTRRGRSIEGAIMFHRNCAQTSAQANSP